jgi:predicted SAM-dependent methyltransferase
MYSPLTNPFALPETMNPIRSLYYSRTTQGVRNAVSRARKEWEMCKRHRASVKRARNFVTAPPIKLHLGCGPNHKDGWVNIDLFQPDADLQLDLRDPWPFPDGSASQIYSEHVFEHFEYATEVPHFLSESLRILQPGGIFDVGVPDTEWPLSAYRHPGDEYWVFSKEVHPSDCITQLDHINYHFRQGEEHKYAWDTENLGGTLQRHGFVEIARRDFDPALDCFSRKTGTLYMRARRKTPCA